MTDREVAELRRRFKPERSNISHVRGCYVNEKKEIIATFDQPLGETTPVVSEQVLLVLRRALSGTYGRNLHDIPFTTLQVSAGAEHALLTRLRKSELADEEAVRAFYDRVREQISMDGNYLILLAHDNYDVPHRGRGEGEEDSTEVFSYIVCCVCPVKADVKPTLGIEMADRRLRSLTGDPCVANPKFGFLFPAFDDRAANIYSALLYTRGSANCHPDFTQAVFGVEAPMPAAAQKETFGTVLREAIGEDCNYAVVSRIRETVGNLIESHKETHDPEPLFVSGDTVETMLVNCGVAEDHAKEFRSRYEEAFGSGTELRPANIVETKKLNVTTPDVSIRVSPDRGDLIETRTIDGVKYVLIRAEGAVEVNGVEIKIND